MSWPALWDFRPCLGMAHDPNKELVVVPGVEDIWAPSSRWAIPGCFLMEEGHAARTGK